MPEIGDAFCVYGIFLAVSASQGVARGSHGDDEGRRPSWRSLLAAACGAGAVEVPESGAEKMSGFAPRRAVEVLGGVEP